MDFQIIELICAFHRIDWIVYEKADSEAVCRIEANIGVD